MTVSQQQMFMITVVLFKELAMIQAITFEHLQLCSWIAPGEIGQLYT